MTIKEIIDFLKTNIWGLIILGGLGSLLATFLIFIGRKTYILLAKRFKIIRTKYFFRRIIQNYSHGYTAGYANLSSYHQALLIGKFIIKTILYSMIIVVQFIIVIGLFSFASFEYYWIIVFCFGITIAVPIYKLRENLLLFMAAYSKLFDEKKIKEKAQEYLVKKVLGKKEDNPNQTNLAEGK